MNTPEGPFVTMPTSQPSMDDTLPSFAALKKDSNIWYKIHVLLYDLRHLEQNDVSRSRLETVVDRFYIGEPYFNQVEAEKIKGARVEGDKDLSTLIEEALRERLECRAKKRALSGDYRICAAHDLAPTLEKAFGIRSKELERSQTFSDIMSANGLHLQPGKQWIGLGKQQKDRNDKDSERNSLT